MLSTESNAHEAYDAQTMRSAGPPRARQVHSYVEDGRHAALYVLELAENAVQHAAPLPGAALESVRVTEGVAAISTGGTKLVLRTGESAYFGADDERTYASLNGAPATLYIVVSHPVASGS